MTTRETTSLLARTHSDSRRSFWDAAAVASFATFSWPWLLRSLDGGSKKEKKRLIERLDLANDALPNLGSWKADTGFLHLIVDAIERERPRRVVEFGVGATSLVIAASLRKWGGGEHLGFDQHDDFVTQTSEWLQEYGFKADLRHAPLAPSPNGWPGLWYETGHIEPGIDMMVVDGPPWTIHPFTRGAAESLFHLLSPGGTIFLDDAARPGERIVTRQWKKLHPEIDFQLRKDGTKGTLTGRRK